MRKILKRATFHLVDQESHHRKIALGFLWVSAFVFIGKLAGAAKEMAIAWRYGVSEIVDAYAFVFNLITWPVSVWFNVLTIVLVPIVVRLKHRNPSDVQQFGSEIFGLSIAVGVFLGSMMWLFLPPFLNSNYLGLASDTLQYTKPMIKAFVFLVPIGVMIGLFSSWMLASGQHRNTILEAIPAIVILFVLVLPPEWFSEPLIWGTVIGFILHMIALAHQLLKQGEIGIPKFCFKSIGWQGFWGGVYIMVIGQTLMGVTTIIDQIYAAGLGAGSLSSIGYANRIFSLLLGMGAMAISRATLPVFSTSVVKSREIVIKTAIHWALLSFMVGLIGALAMWIGSPIIVKTIFERGEFSVEDTTLVSHVLRVMLVQLPFYFSGVVLMNCLVIINSGFKYLTVILVSLLVKLVLLHFTIDEFQLNGLLASMNAFIVVWCILLFLLILKEKSGFA